MTDETTVASLDQKREEVAEKKRTVLGGQAAAALRERRAAAGEEELLYQIGEDTYRIQYPLSAATLIYVSEMMSGDDGLDYKVFAKAIGSLFHPEDQDKVLETLTHPSNDFIADVEYLSDLFAEIMEAVNGRPTNSQPA